MNQKKLYHLDIKDDNLLYDKIYIKLIDFGLATISTPTEVIPSVLFNRYITFNNPFSVCLFSSEFK